MAEMKDSKTFYKALVNKDSKFEGVFIAAVKSTGIFCRPTCTARKPKFENVDFFKNAQEALAYGYRPCKVCQPMLPAGEFPAWIKKIFNAIDETSHKRFADGDIRKLGVDPNRVRRWFKKNHNMTFQSYLRSIRLGKGFGHLTKGGKVIDAAFDVGYESLSGFTEAFKKLTGENPSQVKADQVIYIYQVQTPLGPMIAGVTELGVCLLEFTDRRMLETNLKVLQKRLQATMVVTAHPMITKLQKQLNEYFAGDRREFDLPLHMKGTEFQEKVWKLLISIPSGETRSYAEQAKLIGNTKAVRAVARANGENRIAIIIPCHRVIGSNGDLVGYAGGLPRKKFLLDLEKK